MKTSFPRVTFFIFVLLSLFAVATPVHAGGMAPLRKPANLAIEPLKRFVTGDHPTIVVHLTAEFGAPIPNQPILILVDGVRKGEGRTDSRGIAAIPLKYKFPSGSTAQRPKPE
jgi:hypothetical protein